jgi:hypothetical protein
MWYRGEFQGRLLLMAVLTIRTPTVVAEGSSAADLEATLAAYC